uniref:Uncharacterized protein n=1 Tax=Trichogramma kaykai TaxID=54128 RepID=A0ABD2X5F9_9HYME
MQFHQKFTQRAQMQQHCALKPLGGHGAQIALPQIQSINIDKHFARTTINCSAAAAYAAPRIARRSSHIEFKPEANAKRESCSSARSLNERVIMRLLRAAEMQRRESDDEIA